MVNLKDIISEDAPHGGFLKDDKATFRALRNSFNLAQSAYRELTQTSDTMTSKELVDANISAWKALQEVTENTLLTKSKDIEIFIWYITSLMHKPNSMELAASQMEQFIELLEESWDTVHPLLPDVKVDKFPEDEREKERSRHKLKLFIQLLGEVPGEGLMNNVILNIPLIGDASYAHMISAEKKGNFSELIKTINDGSGIDFSHTSVFVVVFDKINTLLDRLKKIFDDVSLRCKIPAFVSVGNVKETINDILRLLRIAFDNFKKQWPLSPAEDANAVSDAGAKLLKGEDGQPVNVLSSVTAGSMGSRQEALAMLSNLAGYFEATEPHSPIYLLIRRALRWSQLSASELYSEILGEQSDSFNRFTSLTGMESANYKTGNSFQVSIPVANIEPIFAPKERLDHTRQEKIPDNDVASNKILEREELVSLYEDKGANGDVDIQDKSIKAFEW